MSEPKEHTNYLGEPLLNNTIWKDAKKGISITTNSENRWIERMQLKLNFAEIGCLLLIAAFISQLLIVNIVFASSNRELEPKEPQGFLIYLPSISKSCDKCYYVDSINGSDSNSGTIPEKPWRSLIPVQTTHFLPGTTISFKRGSRWNGGLHINFSGADGNPITYTSYGTGERPIITNPGDPEHLTSAIKIYGSMIVVEDFLVQDTSDAGIKILTESSFDIIRNVEATNVGIGISVYGQHNLITQNYIHDVHMVKNTPGGTDDYGANGVLLANSYNEVSFNRFDHCIAPSYDFGVDGGAVEFFDTADGNYIHNNWASNSDGFLEVSLGSTKNTIVAYNVSLNNRRFSVMHLTSTLPNNVVNFRIENNTIIEAPSTKTNWAVFYFKGGSDLSTILLRNNILSIDGFDTVSNVTGFAHSHNLYNLLGRTKLGFLLEGTEKIADPLFIDAGTQNFDLQPSSPAIDAGFDLRYSFDFRNYPIPVGTSPDLGAFEHQ